jgi:ADP-ribose pyrophosphatase YjhB (NUDIX family)
MKEYAFENSHGIDIAKLEGHFIPKEEYKYIHEKTIRACHDVFIEYGGGILFVKRKDFPVKDIPWVLGGGIQRGVAAIDSLRNKAKEECNLQLEDIKEIGTARTFFETDPFSHGKGTDTINFVYFARGKGNLKLNQDHYDAFIVSPEKYTEEFRKSLHPYIRDFMDIAIKLA